MRPPGRCSPPCRIWIRSSAASKLRRSVHQRRKICWIDFARNSSRCNEPSTSHSMFQLQATRSSSSGVNGLPNAENAEGALTAVVSAWTEIPDQDVSASFTTARNYKLVVDRMRLDAAARMGEANCSACKTLPWPLQARDQYDQFRRDRFLPMARMNTCTPALTGIAMIRKPIASTPSTTRDTSRLPFHATSISRDGAVSPGALRVRFKFHWWRT